MTQFKTKVPEWRCFVVCLDQDNMYRNCPRYCHGWNSLREGIFIKCPECSRIGSEKSNPSKRIHNRGHKVQVCQIKWSHQFDADLFRWTFIMFQFGRRHAKKMPNVRSRCHTKRRMGRADPSFGLTPTFQEKKISKVSVILKEGWVRPQRLRPWGTFSRDTAQFDTGLFRWTFIMFPFSKAVIENRQFDQGVTCSRTYPINGQWGLMQMDGDQYSSI